MLHLHELAAKPRAFVSLTGMTPADFDALYADFEPLYQRYRAHANTTRRGCRPRRRAPGAGRPHGLDLRHRLLLALVWLKVYPTFEVLGLFFSLDKGNARRNLLDILAALDWFDDFPFDRDPADRPQRPRSLAQVMEAFPQVRLVIDSKEQRIERPGGGHARQKPFYSGKKKAHTLKTQVAVGPDGRIESVSPAVPGSVNDVRLLRETGLLNRLGEGEAALADKGYEGAAKGTAALLILPKKDRKKNPCTEADKARNRLIARYRIVVEHALAQLNRFGVLRQVYRGGHLRHSQVVRVVAWLVNRRTRRTPLKRYGTAA